MKNPGCAYIHSALLASVSRCAREKAFSLKPSQAAVLRKRPFETRFLGDRNGGVTPRVSVPVPSSGWGVICPETGQPLRLGLPCTPAVEKRS